MKIVFEKFEYVKLTQDDEEGLPSIIEIELRLCESDSFIIHSLGIHGFEAEIDANIDGLYLISGYFTWSRNVEGRVFIQSIGDISMIPKDLKGYIEKSKKSLHRISKIEKQLNKLKSEI